MLNRARVLVLTALVATGLAACGGTTHESAAEEQVELMEEVAEILEDVKDAETAEAAKSKLESLVQRMKELQEELEKLPDPSPEEETRLQEKYASRIMAASQKMMGAMLKLQSNPEALAALEKSLSQLR